MKFNLNLVRIMLESKGLKVVDLGVDVPAHRFVDAASLGIVGML